MESNLDYIICDKNARELSSRFDYLARADKSSSGYSVNDILNFLRKGDRRNFQSFCEEDFTPDSAQFRLIRVTGKRIYSYIFLEKDLRDGEAVNIIFLAPTLADCAPLMSPDTQLYQTASGQAMYEALCILNGSANAANADYLTPEAFVLTSSAFDLMKELAECRSTGPMNAEIGRFCGIIMDKISKTGCRGKLEIAYSEDNVSGNELGIYPILPAVLVHTFMSAVYILSFFSSDNKISVGVNYFEKEVFMEFSAETGDRLAAIDCTDFSEIAERHTELAYPAAVLRILAEAVGYSPSLRCIGNLISMTFKISEKSRTSVRFRYSDPYSGIGAYVDAFAELFGLSA